MRNHSDDLDDLINDLNDVLEKPKPNSKPQQQQPTQINQQQQENTISKKKCAIPNVGNSKSYRICQNLRCNKCDLNVIIHQNKRWNNDIDYLVLRNYFNNQDMLQKYQLDDQNCNAYNCQCYNINATQQEQAPQQWRCAGH